MAWQHYPLLHHVSSLPFSYSFMYSIVNCKCFYTGLVYCSKEENNLKKQPASGCKSLWWCQYCHCRQWRARRRWRKKGTQLSLSWWHDTQKQLSERETRRWNWMQSSQEQRNRAVSHLGKDSRWNYTTGQHHPERKQAKFLNGKINKTEKRGKEGTKEEKSC